MMVPDNINTQCIESKSFDHSDTMLPILDGNTLIMDFSCMNRQQLCCVNAFLVLHQLRYQQNILMKELLSIYSQNKQQLIQTTTKNIILRMVPQNWVNQKIVQPIHKQPQQFISNSMDKLKIKKPIIKNEIELSIKRRSAFDLNNSAKNKSVDRYERSSSQQNGQNKYIQKKSKNYGYVSHLFSVLRRNKSEKKGQNQQQNKSNNLLKQQLSNLTDSNPRQMAPSKIRSNSKSLKKRISINSLSLSKQKIQKDLSTINKLQFQSQVTPKLLKDYSKFIESKINYCTQVNYNHIRSMEKLQAFSILDMKQYKIIESITLCLIDALRGDQPSSENLIEQYCGLFFQSEERRKFQIIINYHVFKSFAIKIKSIYAYERIWFYFISKLAQHKLIFMIGITNLALAGCKLIDKLLKIQFQAVTETLSRGNTTVLEAFKSLKIVKQIQKINNQFSLLLPKIQVLLDKQQKTILFSNDNFCIQFSEILTNFKPFLLQSTFYNQQEYICRVELVLSWKFLNIPPIPYLPQKQKEQKKYTLILGLNKVLILYNHSTRVLKYRPYMDTFLTRLKQSFQIVIFSDFQKPLTDRIVKQIQKDQVFFSARLYRNHMSFKNGKIIKDLEKVGRFSSQVVYLDVKQYIGQYPHNQLQIPDYKVNTINQNSILKQKTLLTAMNKLMLINKQYPNDIRKTIKKTADLYQIPEVASIQQYSISISNQTPMKEDKQF